MSNGVAVNAALLALVSTCALAEENRPPRSLTPTTTWPRSSAPPTRRGSMHSWCWITWP